MNDELLVSYLLGEGDAALKQAVENWMEEDPANKRYFEHFRIIWESSKNVTIPATVNEHAAWDKFKKRTFDRQNDRRVVSLFPRGTRFMRAAAAVVLGIGILAASYLIWNMNNPVAVELVAGIAPVTKDLPDGSTVTINKNSSIRYIGGNKRNVQLKGEAFFNVKPNKQKPFIIRAEEVQVTVVGTSFNVKSTDSLTQVVVESGIVKVEQSGKTITLHAGERVNIRKGDALRAVKTEDKLYSYYVTKEFVCDDTPLWKLVETLNEAYASNIVIGNDDIRSLPLTTTFHNEPLENVLKIISETFNITVDREGDKIILR